MTETSEFANQRSVITHAVLVGLTPLIPVPFVDDLVKGYFLRRMTRALALAHKRQLSAEIVATLTKERGASGCLPGCLGQLFILPLKLIFRKIFFFLEWKRAVDLTSHTYHQGYLLDYALSAGWLDDAAQANPQMSATVIAEAIEEVCREAPIKPVETAIGVAFKQSKSMLRAGAKVLERALRQVTGRPDERQLAEAVTAVDAEEEKELEGVVSRLQKSIGAIPDEHFRYLRSRLAARVQAASQASQAIDKRA
ncbi:MAG: hypothetical protein QOF02_2812 [Blastocatellia bacterium]|jgi:hypothetical protein|nr:hypothetical protein [Blastocatellia bacterium]